MAGNPSIDRFEDLECVERHGVIRSLTRKARVMDVGNTGYQELWQALARAGIPARFSTLLGPAGGANPNTKAFSNLVLIERSAKVVEMDKVVDVTLKYEHLMDGPNQKLITPASGKLYVKGKTSLVQRPANSYYPQGRRFSVAGTVTGTANSGGLVKITTAAAHNLDTGDVVTIVGVTGTTEANGVFSVTVIDATHFTIPVTFVHAYTAGGTYNSGGTADGTSTKTLILVGHTYSFLTKDEQDWPGQYKIQTGEVTLTYPHSTLNIVGYLNTDTPEKFKDNIINKVNLKTWQDKPPRYWNCTDVEYDLLDINPGGDAPVSSLYRFGFEFQYDSDTWDKTVTFKDPRTHQPPSNVRAATNYDTAGVLRNVANEGATNNTDPFQAAGIWDVPALRALDYDAWFSATFPG